MCFLWVLSMVTISRWSLCAWWRDFPVVSGKIIYWKIRIPPNFKYSPTLGLRFSAWSWFHSWFWFCFLFPVSQNWNFLVFLLNPVLVPSRRDQMSIKPCFKYRMWHKLSSSKLSSIQVLRQDIRGGGFLHKFVPLLWL